MSSQLCEGSKESGLAGFGGAGIFWEVKSKPEVRNPDRQVSYVISNQETDETCYCKGNLNHEFSSLYVRLIAGLISWDEK